VDRTNERTEKYGEPSASNHVVSNDTEYSTDYSRDRPRRREAALRHDTVPFVRRGAASGQTAHVLAITKNTNLMPLSRSQPILTGI
jgi:hypothetical protein